jgi:hypothetical protein
MNYLNKVLLTSGLVFSSLTSQSVYSSEYRPALAGDVSKYNLNENEDCSNIGKIAICSFVILYCLGQSVVKRREL